MELVVGEARGLDMENETKERDLEGWKIRSQYLYEENIELRKMLREFLNATPTNQKDEYDPINQPQAYKAYHKFFSAG